MAAPLEHRLHPKHQSLADPLDRPEMLSGGDALSLRPCDIHSGSSFDQDTSLG